MSPIVTGATVFRAKKVLTAAEIHALDTVPVLLAPGIPGKTIFALAVLERYEFGTEIYTFSVSATSTISFGPAGTALAYSYNLDSIRNIGGSANGLTINLGTNGVGIAHNKSLTDGAGI